MIFITLFIPVLWFPLSIQGSELVEGFQHLFTRLQGIVLIFIGIFLAVELRLMGGRWRTLISVLAVCPKQRAWKQF